jgi:ABC-type nitrate/sulfonate/bicarbonate transport system substrate-binding protein
VLRTNGFSPTDFSMVYIQDTSAQIAALVSGQADASVLPEPYTSIALTQGMHVILDSKDTDKYVTVTALMTRRSYVASNRDDVKRALMANMAAAHMLKANPEAMQPYVAPYITLDNPEAVKTSLRNIAPQIVEDLAFPLDAAQKILAESAATIPGVDKLKPEDIIDFSIIDDLRASHFLESLG